MRKGTGHSMAACVIVLIALLFSSSQAAETWLTKTGGVMNPGKAAVMPDGSLAVTSPVWNSVAMLDQDGNRLGSVSSKHPSALAVSPNGNIYVAFGKYSSNTPPYITKGEVKVHDGNYGYMFSLGSGAGEFVNPTDIEIAADGTVYVPDASANMVKVFNADGSLKFSFGTSGIGDGFFNKPLSVSIDNLSGDIYVADCQLVPNTSGAGNVDGVRIQVFGADGSFKRAFGTAAELRSVSDIKYFGGKLYVASDYLDLIQVYDAAAGTLQYGFNNPAGSIRLPSSLAVSNDGVLYVTGTGSNDVNMFGIDNYLMFSVNPSSLNFAAIEGMATAPASDITITNTGNGDIAWSLSSDSWISSNSAAGVIAQRSSQTLAAGVNTASLAAGSYKGNIVIKNQNGTARKVSVALQVIAAPVFSISQGSLSFSADAGSAGIQSQSIDVALNGGLSSSYWTARSTAGWLGVNPVQAGVSSSSVTVSVNAAGLAAGAYSGQIVFDSQAPAGVSAAVDVTLSIASSGVITVKTNLDSAKYSVKGSNGLNYAGQSSEWTQTHVPDGTYTITYGRVAGFTAPRAETLELKGGSSITFAGQYSDLRKSNNILASSSSAENKGLATVRIFSPDGKILLKEFTPFTGMKSKVAYNMAAGDVDGDGVNDVLVGLGSSTNYQALVGIYNNSGDLIQGTEFIAMETRGGAKVAAADFDNDGKAEIIVAAGAAPQSPAQIRIFTYDPLDAAARIKDTGIDITAFESMYGANIAVGDIDGDGIMELIVSPGPDPKAAPQVKVFKVDTTQGVGSWTAAPATLDIAAFAGKCGANVAVGDLDGDGSAEIVVGSGSCSSSRNEVRAFYGNGSPFSFSISEKAKGGYEIATGDIDMDGRAEIVVSKALIKSSDSVVTVYSSTGNSMLSFTAYQKKNSSGAKIALGEMGY